MIVSFADKGTEDLFQGNETKASRGIPRTIWRPALLRLDALDAARVLSDLRFPPGNRLEALKGRRSGFHSIRINNQYRLIFRWTDGNAHDVEITDYH